MFGLSPIDTDNILPITKFRIPRWRYNNYTNNYVDDDDAEDKGNIEVEDQDNFEFEDQDNFEVEDEDNDDVDGDDDDDCDLDDDDVDNELGD